MVKLNNDWDEKLKNLFDSELYLGIREFLKKEYFTQTVYPPMNDIFNCFKFTPFNKVKVVILGQDPYHNPGQAHGLCFSVKISPFPPSLKNIFKEISNEFNTPVRTNGDLTDWAQQGVLLLNTSLSVRKNQANSHSNCGWQTFTDEVIKILNDSPNPIVYLLWGGNARSKKKLITNKNHLVLESAHPSPLSAYAGFFGNNHFKKCNEFLIKNNLEPIKW